MGISATWNEGRSLSAQVQGPTVIHDKSAVTYTEQELTEEQQAQARSNIGATRTLVVEVLDGNVASADAGQVYAAVQNGDYVVMHIVDQDIYAPLSFSDTAVAVFASLWDDYTATVYWLAPNAIVTQYDLTFASGGYVNAIQNDITQIRDEIVASDNLIEEIETNLYDLQKSSVLTTEQELTEEQKAQIRKNIGVGSGGGISVTDDGAGNVEITVSGSVSITDDGNGNVTIE